MKTKKLCLSLALLLAAGGGLLPLSAQTVTTWNGGTSNWEDGSFWSNGIPNSADADVFIDGGKTGTASVVTLQSQKTVGRLTLDSGDTLNLNSNLTIQAGAFAGSGSIINNGEIDGPPGASLNIFFVGNTTISGTGTINLSAAGSTFGQSIRAANGNGDRLTIGAGQTIAGSTASNNGGSLGGGGSTITNNGTINANTSLNAFVIAPGGGNGNDFTNGATGIAQASNGGVLILSGGNFNGGTFRALDGSQVFLSTPALSGATLATTGSGVVVLSSNATLTNVINAGTFNFDNKDATIAGGSLVNNGTINLSGTTGDAIFFNGNTTISGTGTINLLAAGTTFGQSIRSANGNGERITIGAGQTITGSTASNNGGSLGGGNSTITNNGTINANTSTDAFFIQPGGGNGNDFTNGATGLVEATNGGVLLNSSGVFNNNGAFAVISGASGGSSNFLLTAGSLTNFSGTTLTGGTYNVVSTDSTHTSTLSFGGGTITTNAANVTLDGVSTVFAEINGLVSNQGSFRVLNGRNFATASNLANSGTVQAGNGSTLTVNGSYTDATSGTLTGAGTVSANSLTVAGAAAPGDSGPGTLNVIGAFTLQSTARLAFELGSLAGPNDLINLTGNLVLDGTLDITALAGFGTGVYDLLNYTGSLTDNGLQIGSAPAGFTYQIVTTVPGQIDLAVVAVVPEPSTWLLMLGGTALLLWLQRARQMRGCLQTLG